MKIAMLMFPTVDRMGSTPTRKSDIKNADAMALESAMRLGVWRFCGATVNVAVVAAAMVVPESKP